MNTNENKPIKFLMIEECEDRKDPNKNIYLSHIGRKVAFPVKKVNHSGLFGVTSLTEFDKIYKFDGFFVKPEFLSLPDRDQFVTYCKENNLIPYATAELDDKILRILVTNNDRDDVYITVYKGELVEIEHFRCMWGSGYDMEYTTKTSDIYVLDYTRFKTPAYTDQDDIRALCIRKYWSLYSKYQYFPDEKVLVAYQKDYHGNEFMDRLFIGEMEISYSYDSMAKALQPILEKAIKEKKFVEFKQTDIVQYMLDNMIYADYSSRNADFSEDEDLTFTYKLEVCGTTIPVMMFNHKMYDPKLVSEEIKAKMQASCDDFDRNIKSIAKQLGKSFLKIAPSISKKHILGLD